MKRLWTRYILISSSPRPDVDIQWVDTLILVGRRAYHEGQRLFLHPVLCGYSLKADKVVTTRPKSGMEYPANPFDRFTERKTDLSFPTGTYKYPHLLLLPLFLLLPHSIAGQEIAHPGTRKEKEKIPLQSLHSREHRPKATTNMSRVLLSGKHYPSISYRQCTVLSCTPRRTKPQWTKERYRTVHCPVLCPLLTKAGFLQAEAASLPPMSSISSSSAATQSSRLCAQRRRPRRSERRIQVSPCPSWISASWRISRRRAPLTRLSRLMVLTL